MITGLLYDKPERSYQASFLKNDGNGRVLVVIWPNIADEEIIAGRSPEVCRARQVNSTDEFDWESLGALAGYYISNGA